MINKLKNINLRPQTLEECWAVIETLVKINLELFERLNSNSKNSSMPPSSDRNKKKSNNKPSGKVGHIGKSRKLVPSDTVDKVTECPAQDKCTDCSSDLFAINKVTRHQVYDIPLPLLQ